MGKQQGKKRAYSHDKGAYEYLSIGRNRQELEVLSIEKQLNNFDLPEIGDLIYLEEKYYTVDYSEEKVRWKPMVITYDKKPVPVEVTGFSKRTMECSYSLGNCCFSTSVSVLSMVVGLIRYTKVQAN